MGISLFVYTLAIVGLTTMVITPDPDYDQNTTLTTEEIDNMCDNREDVGF